MVSVENRVSQLSDSRVLVVGDVMLDRYWYGSVDRISPEAPVPVVAVKDSAETLGGAANVARNVCALGGSCTLLGIIGNDENGKRVDELAQASGIDSQLIADDALETTVKLRVVARNQQLMRADFETIPEDFALNALHKALSEMIEKFDVVVFSDYGKGTLKEMERFLELSKGKT